MVQDLNNWTVGRVLEERAVERGEHPFLRIVGGETTTYAEMHALALRLAKGFTGQGVKKGDSVVVMLPNGTEVIACWLALGILGAVEASINTGYKGDPLEHAINICEAKVMVLAKEYLPLVEMLGDRLKHLERLIVVGDDIADIQSRFPMADFRTLCEQDPLDVSQHEVTGKDIASIIYTSGTTGPAKAVLMPQAQNYLLGKMTRDALRLGHEDVSYCFHPMFHMAGKFMAVYGTLMAGATMVLDLRFDPTVWVQRLREFGATAAYAHGPMLEMIHAQPETPDDRNHKVTRLCTAPFPKGIAEDFERRFGIRGLEVWGMTEVGIPLWCELDEPLRVGSCGRVADAWYELRIVDPETDQELPRGEPGEIVVRSRHPWIMMQGYMGMPEETIEAWRNLWFHSGDVGYMDEDGNVYFVDRLKDKIRRRAEMVSSYEIESAAVKHPAVVEAVAVGVPSEFEDDDDIKLVLVLRPNAEADPEDILRHMARRLPHYMVPRYIEFVEDLPRTPTNKVRKSVLRDSGVTEQAWDRQEIGLSLREIVKQEEQ